MITAGNKQKRQPFLTLPLLFANSELVKLNNDGYPKSFLRP
jgi:hypothetical protein